MSGAIPFAGSGYRMEIYGRDGTLVASGEDSPQLSEVVLHGAKGNEALAPMPVPQRFTFTAPDTPAGEAGNVGQMYTLFAKSIRDGAIRDRAIGAAPISRISRPRSNCTAWSTRSNRRRMTAARCGSINKTALPQRTRGLAGDAMAKGKPEMSEDGERFDVVYLLVSGTTTAARCPELLRGLVELGFATVIAIPTPNAARVVAAREPRGYRGGAGRRILFRSGDPAAAAARGGAVRAVQLQLAEQAGARHRRQFCRCRSPPRRSGGKRRSSSARR